MSKSVAVVGAGLVGRGWAIVFARAGHDVCLFDVTEKKIADAVRVPEENLADLAANGLLANAAEIRGRITGTTDLETALQKVGWVQECAFENVETKREIFTTVDEEAPSAATLASATSTFAVRRSSSRIACAQGSSSAKSASTTTLLRLASPDVAARKGNDATVDLHRKFVRRAAPGHQVAS